MFGDVSKITHSKITHYHRQASVFLLKIQVLENKKPLFQAENFSQAKGEFTSGKSLIV